MKAVILAGGLGSRLSEETNLKPKPMLEIGEMPILWHVMKIYSAHGINDFIICLGYKGYLIKEYFANYSLHCSDLTVDLINSGIEYHNNSSEPWRITMVDTGQSSMTGGRIARIAEYLNDYEPFCLTYGDGVGDIDITASIEHHKRERREATMTVVTPPSRFGAAEITDGRVSNFAEKPLGDSSRINAGYFVCEKSVIERVTDDNCVWEHGPLHSLCNDGQLSAFVHDGFWKPMDTLREKRELQAMWESGKAPWKIW